MKVFGRIVHATDFSKASRPALVKAMSLAGQNGAPLSIVHVRPPLAIPIGGDIAYLPRHLRDDRPERQAARPEAARNPHEAGKEGWCPHNAASARRHPP
jgi:nucleotide-binding universal stress UspA family protein